jgi:hypothetical protein
VTLVVAAALSELTGHFINLLPETEGVRRSAPLGPILYNGQTYLCKEPISSQRP